MTDKYPTGGYYDRQATAQVTVPPQAVEVQSTGKVVRQSMQDVRDIFVIITCIAVLITLGFTWKMYFDVTAALNDLHNSFTNSGVFGN